MYSHKIDFPKSYIDFPLREISKHFKYRPKEVLGSYLYFNLLEVDINFFLLIYVF